MSAVAVRSASQDVRGQVMDVTPMMAKRWFDDRHTNRPVKRAQVEAFQRAMKGGEWRLNGQPILISQAGRLLDGQHRMAAVVGSGETVRFLVVTGVPEQAMVTIDRGVKRSFADVLGIEGYKSGRGLSAAIGFAMRLQAGTVHSSTLKWSYEQMKEWFLENRTIHDSVSRYAPLSRGLLPLAQVAGLHYLMSRKSPGMATEFWDRVLRGEGIQSADPEFKLRERLISELGHKSIHKGMNERVALCIKAWNYRRSGTKCVRLDFKQGEQRKEDFPVIS